MRRRLLPFAIGTGRKMIPSAPPDSRNPAAPGYGIDRAVVNDIQQASLATGVDFSYLMAQAAQESSFRPDAAAAGSSAKGLYQFIDSTWLQMMHDYGAKYGYGALVREIHISASGKATVTDPVLKQQILALRNNPTISAELGAEYARRNEQLLRSALGRPVTPTDLYLAHFLGPQGATEFLHAIAANGSTTAAHLLPAAAEANPKIFYNADGAPRTLREIYDQFQSQIDQKANLFAALAPAGTATMDGSALAGALADASGSGIGSYSGGASGGTPFSPGLGAGSGPTPFFGPAGSALPTSKPGLSLFSVLALSAFQIIDGMAPPETASHQAKKSAI